MMADPREDFEHEYAKESKLTESRMKFMRSSDGGYDHRDLHMVYKGWRLAKTKEVRNALRRTENDQ